MNTYETEWGTWQNDKPMCASRIHEYMCVSLYVSISVCICIYIYIYAFTYTQRCTTTYMYIHIDKYIHRYIPT